MRYLFELGRVIALSRAEVEEVLKQLKINFTILNISQHFLFIDTQESLDEQKLIEHLGGIISIAQEIKESTQMPEDIADILIKNQPTGKIQFSIQAEHERKLAEEVKKLLKEAGRSARYVPPRNTATIIHNKLVEKQGNIIVIDKSIYVTRAVQPIDEWSERDYGRPGRDSESGMLPPKLARMMINISGVSHTETLLDPFCGSGTVLTEAILLGFKTLIGSDNSEQAIQDTKKNISWMAEKKEVEITSTIIQSDVRELKSHIEKSSVGGIVAEPYMGKPLTGREREDFLHNQAKELGELFVSAFQEFQSVLKSDGIVVFIIPRFWYRGKWIRIECQDRIEKEGFEVVPLTHHEPYILYHRPGQFVGREVWKFKRE